MLKPYRTILQTPGALSFSLAGVLSRLPMSMVTISIVVLVENVYGSYSLAGGVAAVYALVQAVCAPQLAKLIDAWGQARVMRPALAVALTSFTGFALAASAQLDTWVLYTTTAVGGATVGAMGALVRARWNHALEDRQRLHTAYSLESALDELVFVVGPILATTTAAAISPLAGLVVAIVATATGGYWFLAQRRTEPPPRGWPRAEDRGSVMKSAGMIMIALVFIAVGTIFGSVDVSTVAFANEVGSPGLAGVVLAVFATGSLLSGLGVGARQFVMPLPKRFVIGVVALAVGVSMFFLVDSLAILAGVMFVTGFAIAPTLIAGNALVQQLVPASRLTEGLTWVGTAIGVGFALGSWLGGLIVDAHGAHAGYLVATSAGVVAAVVAVVGNGLLRASVAARAERAV